MQTLGAVKQKAAVYLRQGMSPRRLAVTLAVGFAVGCIPLVGLPTGLCVLIALIFRLNQPAIQAANYLAMPFQAALILPLFRLGAKLFPIATRQNFDLSVLAHSPAQAFAHTRQLALQIGSMAGQALSAWLLVAVPVVVLLTPALTAIFRRIPALAEKVAAEPLSLASPSPLESGDVTRCSRLLPPTPRPTEN